jgi:F-type H+-transporting ATPase subunit b
MATQTQESTAAPEAKSAGLPQFDFQWWPGQIVWFLIMFLVVLVFVRLFAAPRVGGAIVAREDKISGDIADARRLKDEAEIQAAAAAAETAQARSAAQRVAAEARAKAQAEVSGKLAAEEAKLAEKGAEAEARINTARDAARANVAGIAADAAGAIVAKLTGRTATPAELTAARGS